ncbi:amylo-alpha-1,6-glucosidase [Nitrososphaera sp.]|uniref:amylo-alpha-1,6-glucosidase n=1 Tax=Nitrososphaera sp. TaxID=1971748 RepID=UPI002ED7E931
MTGTLDAIHTSLSYVKGSLKNATVVTGPEKQEGFVFSLLNPPVPLGGNIVSLDLYIDEIPVQKKSIYVVTGDSLVNAALISEERPLAFKPFQSARFLVINGGLRKGRHKLAIMSRMEGFELITTPFTFSDSVALQNENVVLPLDPTAETESSEDVFRDFATPLALSGKKAYIICSSSGALSAPWTWMGVKYDNGGLYVPPVRVFGRIVVEISMEEGVRKRLPNFVVSSRHENGVLQTRHELAGLSVTRTLFVPQESKGFVMMTSLRLLEGLVMKRGRKKRRVRMHFLIDGNITSYGLAAVSQSNTSRYDRKSNCLHLSTSPQKQAQYFGTIGVAPKDLEPRRILTDSFDNDLELSYDVEVGSQPTEMALVGTGSFTSGKECLREFVEMRDNYAQLLEETRGGFLHYSSSTLTIRQTGERQSAEMNRLIRAYEKAKASLKYLKGEYDGLGPGICAGFPRFPNYWARDTGWSLRGYLAMGDYAFARKAIDNFLRHQASGAKGVTKGELPMIISGRAFLHSTTYGSADSTFLFPWAIRQYVMSTGDLQYLRRRWPAIVNLVDWGLQKDLDGDGFIEHGFTGIATKLPIQDSTWMDHIDRRKSANDVQALFYESLAVGSELARLVGDSVSEKRWSARAEELKSKINAEYWNPEIGYYFDTIRKDGSKDQSIRPNALVVLITGAAGDSAKEAVVLDRIEKDDMTAEWGVRTLSTQDPKYRPAFYHDGAVWPLVTGWAALAELKLGRTEQAYRYLKSMADRILVENGMFAETYRGDRPEPFNSCILQAWSVGMYVHAFLELVLGMKIDMTRNTIHIDPMLPESLKQGCGRMEFECHLPSRNGSAKFSVAIDPANDKLSVNFDNLKTKPRVESSYRIV